MNPLNVHLLKMNGKVVFIDRPLELLVPTSDRPLSSDIDKLKAMYGVRRPVYQKAADFTVVTDGTPGQCVQKISSVFKG